MGESYKQSYGMTIGADFTAYKAGEYTLHLWDMAGQDRFSSMIKSYFMGTLGSLIVFDVTRKDSYQNVPNWVEKLAINMDHKMVPFVLIGNKSDLRNVHPDSLDPSIPLEYVQELSDWSGHDIQYVETSALTGQNVDLAFEKLITNIDLSLGFEPLGFKK